MFPLDEKNRRNIYHLFDAFYELLLHLFYQVWIFANLENEQMFL